MARPSKYETEVKPKLKYVKLLAKAGIDNEDIADFLNINPDTLYEYKKKHKEFSEALNKKEIIDAVESTFRQRLTGEYKATREVYRIEEGKPILDRIEKYEIPLNHGAYELWLKTMNPERWKEKTNDKNEIVEALKDISISFVDASKKNED